MTKQQLTARLEAEGVDPAAYNLEGGTNLYDTYCLGRDGDAWVVYFAERGERYDCRSFTSESEACAHLLHWILADSTTRKG